MNFRMWSANMKVTEGDDKTDFVITLIKSASTKNEMNVVEQFYNKYTWTASEKELLNDFTRIRKKFMSVGEPVIVVESKPKLKFDTPKELLVGNFNLN